MQRTLPIRIADAIREPSAASTADSPVDNRDLAADNSASMATAAAPVSGVSSGFSSRRTRWIAGAGAMVVALLLTASFFLPGSKPVVLEESQNRPQARTVTALEMQAPLKAVAKKAQGLASENRFAPPPPPANPQGPMIARSVSLTILVKDFAASRLALDRILTQIHGYPASLTVSTPEDGGRSLQASLRIPADDLASAIGGLRSLGHVLSETQSGEEVTQQHADLVARLQNSREEETRLRAILEQRTGKIEDVLQVEEAIARVRGEIESMEAEQKLLEHRVEFATIDLQFTEEYTEQLNPSAESASTRIYNAFVAGLRNASATVLGILLFLEEFGPAILVWLVILGVPVLLIWRRYRRMRRAT